MSESCPPSDALGMHSVTPHMVCAGGGDAIDFYKKAFNAEEIARFQTPQGKLMHSCIRIGDSLIMIADEFPEWGSLGPNALKGSSVTIHLNVADTDKQFQQAINAGCEQVMPAGRHVLGRPLRHCERPVRPLLVDCHACARCQS